MAAFACLTWFLLSIVQGALTGVDAASDGVRARIAQIPDGARAAEASRVLQQLGAGRIYLALHLTHVAWLRPTAERFVRDRAGVRTAGAFQSHWRRAEAELAPPRYADRLPLVLRALAASAHARSGPTLRGSLPYAQDIDLQDGLYYLGEALALSDLAGFYASAPLRVTAAPPRLRSVATESNLRHARGGAQAACLRRVRTAGRRVSGCAARLAPASRAGHARLLK